MDFNVINPEEKKEIPLTIPLADVEAQITHLQEELKKISEDWQKSTGSEMLSFVRHLCENVPSIAILWMVTDAQLHILNSLLPEEKKIDLKSKEVSLVPNKIITPN